VLRRFCSPRYSNNEAEVSIWRGELRARAPALSPKAFVRALRHSISFRFLPPGGGGIRGVPVFCREPCPNVSGELSNHEKPQWNIRQPPGRQSGQNSVVIRESQYRARSEHWRVLPNADWCGDAREAAISLRLLSTISAQSVVQAG
jgi:hypothetical protein